MLQIVQRFHRELWNVLFFVCDTLTLTRSLFACTLSKTTTLYTATPPLSPATVIRSRSLIGSSSPLFPSFLCHTFAHYHRLMSSLPLSALLVITDWKNNQIQKIKQEIRKHHLDKYEYNKTTKKTSNFDSVKVKNTCLENVNKWLCPRMSNKLLPFCESV